MKYFLHIDQRTSCSPIRRFFKDEMSDQCVESVEDCDIIIVGGGDGWMLQALRKYAKSGKVLVGVNCGTFGFMLNSWTNSPWKNLKVKDLTILQIPKVNVEVTHNDGSTNRGFFYNDCVFGNHILDYATYSWRSDQGNDFEAMGTGLVVSTMLGSTGYALNLGQPVIPVDANLWSITGIATAPFGYQYVAPTSLTIHCMGRQEIMIGMDGRAHMLQNVKSVRFSPSDHSIQIGFLSTNHFATKRVFLAQDKMGGK